MASPDPASPTPPKNPLEPLVGYQLRRASLVISADLATRLEPLSLTVVSMSVLLVIDANPGITQSQIGRLLAIKSANMAPLIAQLSHRGLVAREAADGRSQGLTLSAEGQSLARQAWACIEDHEAWFLQGLTHRETEASRSFLQRMWTKAPAD